MLEVVFKVHEREGIFFTCVSEMLDDVRLSCLSLYSSFRFVRFDDTSFKESFCNFDLNLKLNVNFVVHVTKLFAGNCYNVKIIVTFFILLCVCACVCVCVCVCVRTRDSYSIEHR